MNRQFFKLIQEAHDVAVLANALAMNANYDSQYDDCMRDILPELQRQLHDCQQAFFQAVRHQTAGEPWCKDV